MLRHPVWLLRFPQLNRNFPIKKCNEVRWIIALAWRKERWFSLLRYSFSAGVNRNWQRGFIRKIRKIKLTAWQEQRLLCSNGVKCANKIPHRLSASSQASTSSSSDEPYLRSNLNLLGWFFFGRNLRKTCLLRCFLWSFSITRVMLSWITCIFLQINLIL